MVTSITFIIFALALSCSFANGLNCFVGYDQHGGMSEKTCPEKATHCIRRERQKIPICNRRTDADYIIDVGCVEESSCSQDKCDEISFLGDHPRIETTLKLYWQYLTCRSQCFNTSNGNAGKELAFNHTLSEPSLPPVSAQSCAVGYKSSAEGEDSWNVIICPKGLSCGRLDFQVRTDRSVNFTVGACSNSSTSCSQIARDFMKNRNKSGKKFFEFCGSRQYEIKNCRLNTNGEEVSNVIDTITTQEPNGKEKLALSVPCQLIVFLIGIASSLSWCI